MIDFILEMTLFGLLIWQGFSHNKRIELLEEELFFLQYGKDENF